MASTAVSTWVSGYRLAIETVIAIVGAKDVNFDRICRVILWSVVLSTLVVVTLWAANGRITEDVHYKSGITGDGLVARYTAGFSSPHNFGRSLAVMVFCYVALHYREFSLRALAASLAAAVACVFYAAIYTSAVAILLASVGAYLLRRFGTRAVRPLIATCVVAVALGFVLPAVYTPSNALLVQINSLTASRLSWTHWCIEHFPVRPFGQVIQTMDADQAAIVGGTALFLDNMYWRLLLNFGPVTTVLFLMLYAKVIARAIRHGRMEVILLLAVYLVCGISEKYFIQFFDSFPMLALLADLE